MGLLFLYIDKCGVCYRGKAVSPGGKGGLVVLTESGERILRGGEISVRFLG